MFTQLWNRNRIVLKSFWIGLLGLVLLVPTAFVFGLINERQERRQTAVNEISSRWAGAQTVTGPVISIPYMDPASGDGQQKKRAYFLPDRLDIKAKVLPETRYRGIYRVTVYTTELEIHCHFDSLRLQELNLASSQMIWNEAAVFLNLSDLHGLSEEVSLQLSSRGGNSSLGLVPEKFSSDQFRSALSAALPPAIRTTGDGSFDFSGKIRLKGTGSLSFIPSGRETRVEATSSWPDPSFTGSSLPDLRTVKDSGFVANWLVLSLNRNFPQQWKDNIFNLDQSAFGVGLIVPVDAYQQTTRCVKYAILVIILTFTAFFLIEWVYQRPIHSLQYLLVGFALCLFYTLLLSFSEYIGFSAAYGVAALATIGLISWYVGSMLRSGKMSLFIGFLLAAQYGFIFTLIQLQDYALLMGSIGLFITLALVMHFSRKIKWATA
jgi:inner membrane protein